MDIHKNYLKLNMDAFSDGQMRSKLWLCNELEKILRDSPPQTIWVYGSWYGVLALLLLTRQSINIKKICLFDIDSEALEVSRKILNSWEIRGPTLGFHNMDCTKLNPTQYPFSEAVPDLVINTSCEHFENRQWLDAIPTGTLLAVQSTDMAHPTHIQGVTTLGELKENIPMRELLYSGQLDFQYPDSSFLRFMLIGKK